MILPEAETILAGDDRPPVAVRRAVFAGVIDRVAWVDMGDSRFPCEFGSGHVPKIADTVNVLSIGGRHLLYPARALPGTGTVLTVSGDMVGVSTIAGDFQMPYVGSVPSSGELVGISWSEVPFVIGKLSTQPNQAPAPVPPPTKTLRSATFRAIDAGATDRHQVRWWTGQPQAGNSSFGAWFYGSQIKDTIPADAVVESMEMYISKQKSHPAAPNFTLHTSGWKQGIPAMSGVLPWNPGPGWNYVPNAAWFDALKAGGAYWGIGLNQGGYTVYSSLAEDSMSGALRITWRS